ncbi:MULTISPECIES: immunity 49 family protein [Streptomyces]|uniref:immunity 49 family protein n=1 Tax=Streptomyces sp. SID3915 TaxID=2690263 RepID=UPI0031FC6A63
MPHLAHQDRTLQATGPQWYVTPGSWITAFYLAVICREKDRITALCHVPLSLLRENGTRFDAYHYDWIDTLQTYWLGGPDLVQKLVAAVDGRSSSTTRSALASRTTASSARHSARRPRADTCSS